MKYQAPYGSSDPDAPYVDESTADLILGSVPPAAAIEDPQRELVALLIASGLTEDEDDLEQVLKAVRSQRANYFTDTGTANALVITPVPAFTDLSQLVGVPLRIKKGASANSGATTVTINGLGPLTVKTKNAAALVANAWPAGIIDTLTWNGTYLESQNGNLLASLNADGSVVQTAPYFTADGVAGSATYANNVASVSADLALTASNFLDSGTGLSGGILTIGAKDAGVWQFNANLGINTATISWASKVSLQKNGSGNFAYTESLVYGTNGTGNIAVSGIIRLAAGDTVRPLMLQNTGSSQTSSVTGHFSGSRVGK